MTKKNQTRFNCKKGKGFSIITIITILKNWSATSLTSSLYRVNKKRMRSKKKYRGKKKKAHYILPNKNMSTMLIIAMIILFAQVDATKVNLRSNAPIMGYVASSKTSFIERNTKSLSGALGETQTKVDTLVPSVSSKISAKAALSLHDLTGSLLQANEKTTARTQADAQQHMKVGNDPEDTCVVTQLNAQFFASRVEEIAGDAIAEAEAQLTAHGSAVATGVIVATFQAALSHIKSGGDLSRDAIQASMVGGATESVKEEGARIIDEALTVADISIDICIMKRIASKDIYFAGRLEYDHSTRTLSGSLTMLSRIDLGYVHLSHAVVSVTNVPVGRIDGRIDVEGPFCAGSISACQTAAYGDEIDANDAAAITARENTFTGRLTLSRMVDGTLQITITSGPGSLTFGNLFYVNIEAAVDADRAQEMKNWLGVMANVGVSNMDFTWTKIPEKTLEDGTVRHGSVTKRFTAVPTFGAEASTYTCDVFDDQFSASKCAIKTLDALTGNAEIVVESTRRAIPDFVAEEGDEELNTAIAIDRSVCHELHSLASGCATRQCELSSTDGAIPCQHYVTEEYVLTPAITAIPAQAAIPEHDEIQFEAARPAHDEIEFRPEVPAQEPVEYRAEQAEVPAVTYRAEIQAQAAVPQQDEVSAIAGSPFVPAIAAVIGRPAGPPVPCSNFVQEEYDYFINTCAVSKLQIYAIE